MDAQEFTLGAGGNWWFGQDRQERKWCYKLYIIVDIVGRNVLNENGVEQEERGGDEYSIIHRNLSPQRR